jgi:hypothetical protein
VYAVPVYAMGMGYLIILSANILNNILKTKNISALLKKVIIVLLTISISYYVLDKHIKHIKSYIVPTVFSKKEVAILDHISDITSKNDYVISWWDYGYPLRYYSQVQTLIDGGRHNGKDNYPVSFALSRDPISSANILKLAVEDREKQLVNHRAGSFVSRMMKDYNFKSSNDFISSLKNPNNYLQQNTRNIYLYLPFRMMNIFPTINLFENIDLETGRNLPRQFFNLASIVSQDKNSLLLSNGIKLLIDGNNVPYKIESQGRKYDINRYIATMYEGSKVKANGRIFNKQSDINIIFLRDYAKVLVLSNKLFESTYVQLFVLENYQNTPFEPVKTTPLLKVFKLRK